MTEKEMSGNKGDWSELYAFLKSLGDGRIYGADGELRIISEFYLDINGVFRHDDNQNLEYRRDSDKGIVSVIKNQIPFTNVQIQTIVDEYRYLLTEIKRGKNSFTIPKTERFVRSIGCTSIKAPSKDKTDITMDIHEPRTGMDLIQGFSIKSKLGSPSTLVNASEATNFVFRLKGKIDNEIINRANIIFESKEQEKIRKGLKLLKSNGMDLEFEDTNKPVLYNNLTIVDSSMPKLVSEMLLLHFVDGKSHLKEQVKELNRLNPLKYRENKDYPYYEQKIKKLLVSYALGMQSDTKWNGYEEANGGYIVVKENGDVICYHIFDRMNFEEYLLKNTKMETASSTRHKYARIYNENGMYHIKLNLQIRFI